MVRASVCGTRATVKVPWASSTPATVRLTPSIAIEPFSATYGARCGGRAKPTSRPSSASRRPTTRVVPSTWPRTRGPSSPRSGVTGSSRLTRSPTPSRPRLVRRRVSGTTSATKAAPSTRTAVRHTPLTATLPPTWSREAVAACSRRRDPGRWSTTRPIPLTIPVNIADDQEILAQTLDVESVETQRLGDGGRPPPPHRRRCLPTAHDDRRQVRVHAVHQPGIEEGAVDGRPAFDQEADDTHGPQAVEQARQVSPPVDQEPALPHLRRRRRAPPGIEDDLQGLTSTGETGRQRRVVPQDGVHPHQDGVVPVPETVGVGARGRARDPAGMPGSGRDLAVEAGGELDTHERAPRAPVFDVELVEPPGAGLQRTHVDADAGLPQPLHTPAADPRIGIEHGHHHPSKAGGHDRLDARRRAPLVRAGLEADIQGAAAGPLAGGHDRLGFGVWRSRPPMVPLADRLSARVDHHRTHHRVGARTVRGTCGQGDGPRHPTLVDDRLGRRTWWLQRSQYTDRRRSPTSFSEPRARHGAAAPLKAWAASPSAPPSTASHRDASRTTEQVSRDPIAGR